METNDLPSLIALIREFSDARDWERFHTPKNLAMALSVEVAELAEHFQWLTPEEATRLAEDEAHLQEISSEVADVAIYLFRMADVLGIDLGEAVRKKVEENDRRFPADEIRGRATLQ